MKKLLAVTLVMVFVLGLAVMAFASPVFAAYAAATPGAEGLDTSPAFSTGDTKEHMYATDKGPLHFWTGGAMRVPTDEGTNAEDDSDVIGNGDSGTRVGPMGN